MLANKPAVFDAFNDCAQHLIDAGVTRPDRLAAFGYSNGGLLVGGAVALRPDLYAVAMPTVGVLDMLRFPQFTNLGRPGPASLADHRQGRRSRRGK